MHLTSKKISLLILFVTAAVCSREMFTLFNDPEGPNLLVVGVMTAIIFFPSVAAYLYYPSTKLTGQTRLLLAIVLELLIVSGFYLVLHVV